MTQHVTLSVTGEVATVRLSRPDAGNRLTNAMAAALGDALDASRARRLIVLRGDGNDFCIGRDMQAPPPGSRVSPADVVREDTGPMLELFDRFRRCPQPVIAVIQGRAWGIGTVFAGLCDITYATPDASFRLAELERGIPPAIAMSALLDRMPMKTLGHLVYSTEAIDAASALAAGLISRVCAADEIEGALDALVQRLLAFAPDTVNAVKSYLANAPRNDHARSALLGSSVLANVLASR